MSSPLHALRLVESVKNVGRVKSYFKKENKKNEKMDRDFDFRNLWYNKKRETLLPPKLVHEQ